MESENREQNWEVASFKNLNNLYATYVQYNCTIFRRHDHYGTGRPSTVGPPYPPHGPRRWSLHYKGCKDTSAE
jgi:hypothetical protein